MKAKIRSKLHYKDTKTERLNKPVSYQGSINKQSTKLQRASTGLQFYRKKQTIEQLAFERPQSLHAFRMCVSNALLGLDHRIDTLQQSYYGPGINIDQEIKRWLSPLSKVLRENKISVFLCKTQLDGAMQKLWLSEGDPTMVVDFDKDATRIVIGIIDRVIEYLKTGFADIIKELKFIAGYMQKYCLSFSTTKGNLYLDTAVNYEKQRKEFSEAVSFNLDDIFNMAEQFEAKGIRLEELGVVARELAERCNATKVPFLVIIPQSFQNLRLGIAAMRQWLEADGAYADFIKFDINDMEIKRDVHEQLIRDMQIKCSNCDHKFKTAERHLGEITVEAKRFRNREMLLIKERADTVTINKDLLSDLDIKVFRKADMEHRLDALSNFELDTYKLLDGEIEELSEKQSNFEKKLNEVTKKLDLIRERKELMVKKEREVAEAKVIRRKMKKEYRKSEVELQRLEASLAHLKEIYRYKTTPEILKKIFNGIPLTGRHVVNKGKIPIVDKLERCCKITAAHIENDWTRLYHALPFYPARGAETISNDVDEIGKEYMRHVTDEMCRQSLWRWRRMHIRASVEDLNKALLSIRRKDIVDLIEEDMVRRANKHSIPSPAFRTIRFPKLLHS